MNPRKSAAGDNDLLARRTDALNGA